jgi:hypothetical protein
MIAVLFLVALAAALGVFLWKIANPASHQETDSFPVTIIRNGKSVTFDGFDKERREREFAAATAQIQTAPVQRKARADSSERMTVAITGALSEPRAQLAIRINSTTNARFVERVFLDTDYLVATRTDTAKAKAAAQNGTIILSEQQLGQYISAGEFPHHQRRHTHSGLNFDESEIQWEDAYDPPIQYRLAYADSDGEYSERIVEVTHLAGKHPNGHEYLGAFDEGQLKTFRRDRILKLERVS